MECIVVDTNIVFSTFLNVNSRIGQILLNGEKHYTFYSPEYVKHEVFEHKEKIKSIGNLSEDDFIELFATILKKIQIINHSIIPKSNYQNAIIICEDIDIDDVPFIAINDFVKGKLWTGDLKLIRGLESKGYLKVITTNELYSDFIQKQ